MKTILLTNIYNGTPLDIVNSAVPEGFRLIMPERLSQDYLEKYAPEADYILASGRLKIGRQVLSKAKRLRMVQRTGVGLDSLDLEALREMNIPLYVNQGVNSQSVAEHALLLMLACLRHLTVINNNTKNGVWKKQEQGTRTHELNGKTVGLIGMGNTARTLARLLCAFDVELLYYDCQKASAETESKYHLKYRCIEEILKQSDIISMHCALTEETRGMINRESIGWIKNGAVFINTARGQLADSCALAEALKSGKLSFAGIDVHEEEPLSANYVLKGLDNVILTPHIAGVTYESFYNMMHDAMRNIELFDREELESIQQFRYL